MPHSSTPADARSFDLDDHTYLVTGSAGPHTVNVYREASGLMVCSVRQPLGAAEAAWARQWDTAPEDWRQALLARVADTVGIWSDPNGAGR